MSREGRLLFLISSKPDIDPVREAAGGHPPAGRFKLFFRNDMSG